MLVHFIYTAVIIGTVGGKFMCTILGVSQLDPILQASYLLALFPQHIR